jgi:DNA-nicking Smr family endonuclease
MSKKKTEITQADLDLFHHAVAGSKKLPQKKIRLGTPVKQTSCRQHHQEDEETLFHFSDAEILNPVEADTMLEYAKPDLDNKILRKLRKGQYNVEAILDLHGMTIETARNAVDRLLRRCLHDGIRVVLIIHGKGHPGQTPILKNKLNDWLRDTQVILAFCSALPAHGGRGAIYVLLKRMKEENTLG